MDWNRYNGFAPRRRIEDIERERTERLMDEMLSRRPAGGSAPEQTTVVLPSPMVVGVDLAAGPERTFEITRHVSGECTATEHSQRDSATSVKRKLPEPRVGMRVRILCHGEVRHGQEGTLVGTAHLPDDNGVPIAIGFVVDLDGCVWCDVPWIMTNYEWLRTYFPSNASRLPPEDGMHVVGYVGEQYMIRGIVYGAHLGGFEVRADPGYGTWRFHAEAWLRTVWPDRLRVACDD